MESTEKIFLIALAIVNLAAGFSFAILIAKRFDRIDTKSIGIFKYFVVLVSVYFIECVAFPVGMATQVFTVGLAFIWGTVLGLRFRTSAPRSEVKRLSIFVALYTCFPTVSFCVLLPLIIILEGGHILNVNESIGFGIPSFLPWPFNTILGFFAALLVGTVILKIAFTTGSVVWVIRRWERSSKLHIYN